MIRCIFFDYEIKPEKCIEMQLTDKAICKTCEAGKPVMKIYNEIKNKKKEKIMPTPEGKQCKIEGCEKYKVREGYCIKHYNEAHGIGKGKSKKSGCSTEGCTSPVQKEGLCYKCYKGKYGKPPYEGSSKKKRGSQGARQRSHKPQIAGSSPAPAIKKSGGGDSFIRLDLSSFPKIHRYCTALDFINPSDMLGVILRQRLHELEEMV